MSASDLFSLSSIAEVIQGGRLKLSGNDFVESGVPAYGAGGLNGYLEAAEFNGPAVVLSSIGARCGKCFFVDGPWASLANTQLIFPDLSKVDPKYLWYQLNDETGWVRSGTAQPFIKPSNVKSRIVKLPPIAEQRRIAEILGIVDTQRLKRREAIAKLDQLLKSEFVEIFGNPLTNPKGWKELPIGQIASSSKIGLVRSSEEFGDDFEVPYVRMDAVSADGSFLPERVKKTIASESEVHDFSLLPGDFLFNTRNSKELVGKSCIYTGPRGWIFNNNLMRIRFKDGINSRVIAMQFQFPRVKRELEKRKSGTTNVFAVYWRELQSLPLFVPPPEVQDDFNRVAVEIEKQKRSMQMHAAKLDFLFASLKSRAFGEMR